MGSTSHHIGTFTFSNTIIHSRNTIDNTCTLEVFPTPDELKLISTELGNYVQTNIIKDDKWQNCGHRYISTTHISLILKFSLDEYLEMVSIYKVVDSNNYIQLEVSADVFVNGLYVSTNTVQQNTYIYSWSSLSCEYLLGTSKYVKNIPEELCP